MGTVIMNRAIKYRLYPTEEQKNLLAQTFGCVRKVFNISIEMQCGLYEAGFSSMSKKDLNNYCNRVWKEEFPFLKCVDKFALTNSIYAVAAAYKNFFEKRSGYPKFKSRKNQKDSYTTNQTNGNIAIEYEHKGIGKIKLPKLGKVDAKVHRLPGPDWTIKSATISRTPTGKYFVSILFEIKSIVPNTEIDPKKSIGLDYSSPNFYVDSNGKSPNVLHAYRKAESRLAKEQKKLARLEKGSQNYEKQRIVIAKIHERVANQRKNFCHTESRKIANSYDIVCVENIDLRAQAQTLNFGKAVSDNGFGMFRTFLQYKLESQGKRFVKINKWYPSTKTCHYCGNYNRNVALGQKTWICPQCGHVIDRDYNAALNIRDEGLRTLGYPI